MSSVNAGHYVLGTEGLALLRSWLVADAAWLGRRVDELRRLLNAADRAPMSIRLDVPELDVRAGYARWASSYDAAPNPLMRVEEPVVRRLIDAAPAGVALDAACGTGRHTAYLRERGHAVVGVDATPEMLDRARARVPEADLRVGDLEALPLDGASVDLAVCALALTHVRDIGPVVAELARVLRRGGRLVLSDFHPTMLLLGGSGVFFDAGGAAGNVVSFHHSHASYLRAFRAAGLEVADCVEPVLEEEDLAPLSGGLSSFADEAFRSAWLGIPTALVWDLRRRA
jgi:ubiquinone/menaquinone biosynthesis C-methylase UbiE